MSAQRLTSRQTVFRPEVSPNKRYMSIDDMIKAAYHLGNGATIRDVASSVNRSPTAVHRVKQLAEGRVAMREELNFDRVLLSHFVAFCLLENPMASGNSICRAAGQIGLQTSTASVNRIAHELHFASYFTQKQESLTKEQKVYRVEFCRKIQLWQGFLLPWVFSDETMLVLNPTKSRIRIIRGIDSEAKYISVRGYPAKLMVWAAVGKDFKSPLVRVTASLTAIGYQHLLTESSIFELLNGRYGKAAFVFQQDGASPHTARSTLKFLEGKAELLPRTCHWPASSPDLNVIENLWAILKRQMKYSDCHNLDAMYSEAVRAWEEIPMHVVNRLIDDFLPRLRTCEALNGECINRYKSVLRGFRNSLDDGKRALTEALECDAKKTNFLNLSRNFFTYHVSTYMQWSKLAKDAEKRENELRVNREIGDQSRLICFMLPESIQRKSGLPLQPVAVTSRVKNLLE